jgi:endonuclease III
MSSALKQKVLAKAAGLVKKIEDPAPLDVLHRMVYAICREDATREEADEAYKKLGEAFFDLNEVRVSAAREVARALRQLPDNMDRAERIISILQEVFETTYSFDLEGLHKKGVKQAQKILERYRGSSPFMVAYVLRHSMDAHAIPVDASILRCLKHLEVVEEDADIEDAQGALENMIPKAKGVAVAEGLTIMAREYIREQNPTKKSGSSPKLATAKKK